MLCKDIFTLEECLRSGVQTFVIVSLTIFVMIGDNTVANRLHTVLYHWANSHLFTSHTKMYI